MNMRRIFTNVALLPASLALSVVAHGQAGVCKDPWITQAFHQMYQRAPLGSARRANAIRRAMATAAGRATRTW